MKALKCAVLSLGLLALMAPSIAFAQTCIGTPAGQGQFAVHADMGVGEGFKAYGAGVQANLDSPLSVGADFSLTKPNEIDENVKSVAANAAMEVLSTGQISACPVVGLGYSMFSIGELDTNTLAVPVGIGVGTALPVGSMNVNVFATPQYVWHRSTASIGDESESAWGDNFVLNAGLRLGAASYYVGGSVGLTNVDDSEPVYNFGIGLVVGGRR